MSQRLLTRFAQSFRHARQARVRAPLAALALSLVLAACGGGGGSDATSTAGAATPSSAPSNTTTVAQSTTPNVVAVSVHSQATPTLNMLTASVTVCVPNTSNCTTIPNVQVDTASSGLRLLASVLPSGFSLPAVTAGATASPAGECSGFGTGYTWGAVRLADIQLGGEKASSLPIQVIADSSVPNMPGGCTGTGVAMQDVSTLHVNGILGVGTTVEDCGTNCVTPPSNGWYYACPSGNCTPSAQPLAQQVSNPVAAFATDNNGVVITLPAIGSNGAASTSGTLTFGIGSQSNNTLGTATTLRLDAHGYVKTTTSDGIVYPYSFLDSGSNGLFFTDPSITQCGSWYCPASPLSYSATVTGADGTSAAASFTVTSANTLGSTGNWAFDNLAGDNASSNQSFDLGLPFFYGRRVFTAIEGQPTPVGLGPYFAF